MTPEKDEIIKYLRHVGKEFDPEDEEYVTSPECGRRRFCPEPRDCGICRFEYMKRKGWLSPDLK